MTFTALTCPQCAAPLPRQARWRMVTCAFCSAVVTRSEDVVQRARFRAALLRERSAQSPAPQQVELKSHAQLRLRVLAPLGRGTSAEVVLSERMAVLTERVTLKLALDSAGAESLQREARVLADLQRLDGAGAAYFTRQLPHCIAMTEARDWNHRERQVLLLRHPVQVWGSLDRVMAHQPGGIDPRHAVWMWRRVLAVLGFVHAAGWCHGDVAPDHLLLQPRDHGVFLIGWSRAARFTPARRAQAIGRDLAQIAWTVRALLADAAQADAPPIPAAVPAPLAMLLRRCSEDSAWSAGLGAGAIDDALRQAAAESFGAPRFIHFNPTQASH